MPEGDGFVQGDLKWICTEPGKTWKLEYKGLISNGDQEENVKIDLTWKAISPIVNFDKIGTNPSRVGKQIAKEKWNTTYFKKLHEIKQVHYEQGGMIAGTIEWKGEKHSVDLKGIRDHSWGVRNWEDWDRHFWLLGILDDGSFFNISQISYSFVKNLIASFIFNGEKFTTIKEVSIFEDIDIKNLLPDELKFTVKKDMKSPAISVEIKMLELFPFIMDDIYYIREAKAEFTFDGKKGIGVAELGVNLKNHDVDVSTTH